MKTGINQPTPEWGKGKVKIGAFSSLRKLMRAARRGLIPDERQGIITRAMEAARKRQDDNRRRNHKS